MKAITWTGVCLVLILSALANASNVRIECTGKGFGEKRNRALSGFKVVLYPESKRISITVPQEAYDADGEGYYYETCSYKLAMDPVLVSIREPLRTSKECQKLDTTMSFDGHIERLISRAQYDSSYIEKLSRVTKPFYASFYAFDNLDYAEPIASTEAQLTCKVVTD